MSEFQQNLNTARYVQSELTMTGYWVQVSIGPDFHCDISFFAQRRLFVIRKVMYM